MSPNIVCNLMTRLLFVLVTLLVSTHLAAIGQSLKTPAGLIHETLIEAESSDRTKSPAVHPSLLYVKISQDAPVDGTPSLIALLSETGLPVIDVASFADPGSTPDLSTGKGGSPEFGAGSLGARRGEQRLRQLMVVRFDGDISPLIAARALARSPYVLVAEPVPVATVLAGSTAESPDDPRLSEQKQIPYIRADQAWQIHAGDTSVVIGIIDAGVTQGHEDLTSNIAPNYGELGLDGEGNPRESNGIDDDENGYVDDAYGVNLVANDGRAGGDTKNGEHGTQVAGYAAAATDNGVGIAGVANQGRFFPMKAATFNRISIIGGFDGLLYAARAGFKVANLSWGQVVRSEVEEEIIRIVVEDFDVSVVSAGGNLNEMVRFFPAGYRYVLGVGGVNELSGVITTWGEHLDVVAQAGLTTSGENDYYDLSSASSYATPIASGVVALARGRWPSLTARGAIEHTRNNAVNIDAFNAGRVGFIGRGRVDALNVVEDDPALGPGIQVDSVWVVDAQDNRTDGLLPGEEGQIRLALTNVLGDVSDLTVSILAYTDDSTSVRLGATVLNVGQIPSGESWVAHVGFPVFVETPGVGPLPVRFEFSAPEYSDYSYELVDLHKTYFVLSENSLDVTMTTSGRVGGDFGPAGLVGEGVSYNGIGQLYEGGIIMSYGADDPIDNLRGFSQIAQSDDFRPIDPATFPRPVQVAVARRDATEEDPGVRVGTSGAFIEGEEGLFRLTWYLHNASEESYDSVRFAFFGDWDLDQASGQQRVSRVEHESLPSDLFPTIGVVESGLLTTLAVAVESGRRGPESQLLPLFFANDNAENPANILDGFSEEEKEYAVSNGIAAENAGPGDVSLASGVVFTNLGPGDIDSISVLLQFGTGGKEDVIERLVAYKEQVYGTGGVTIASSEAPVITVSGESLLVEVEQPTDVRVVDLLGRIVARAQSAVMAGSTRIELSHLTSGRYLLLVTTGNEVHQVPIEFTR